MGSTDEAAARKRELLMQLEACLQAWDGLEALNRVEERALQSVLDRLDVTRGIGRPEQHFLNLCETWLVEARRKPGPGLRQQWLQATRGWLACRDEHGFLVDT